MNIKSLKVLILTAALLTTGVAALHAAEASKEDAAVTQKLLTATEKSDYSAFIADGEPVFQQFKKEQFEAVAAKLAPKLQVGYDLSYLGDLKQHGYHVTLWKLSFKDGSDDMVATLSMKDGKIGGFFIR